MNFLAFIWPVASRMASSYGASVRVVTSLVLLTVFTQVVMAQQTVTKPETDAGITRQLLKRVEELEARLRELESKQANTASASLRPTDTPATDVVADQPVDRSVVAPITPEGLPLETPVMQIKGYADVTYQAGGENGEKNAFAVGQLDLFITSRLSKNLSMLGEVVIEAGQDNKVGVDLERLVLQYSPSDELNVSFGRYHTAIGYYNTAYHHGQWFQTTIDRPAIFAFEDEGGVLPIHNIGVSATGRIPSGKLGLRFIAEIGNGRTSRSPLDEPVQNVVDENNGKAVNLGLLARPDWLPGLQAGFSVYRDQLKPKGLPEMGQTILAGHVVYLGQHYEILNEALVIRHPQQETGRVFHTTGFYTQVARKFGKYQPYARYQYLNSPSDEPLFLDVSRRHGPSVGLRYELSEFLAFKAQYDHVFRRGLSATNKLKLQLAFTF